MKTRIAGFQMEGTWPQVVAHGDRITEALRELGPAAHPRMDRETFGDAMDEWESWRPQRDDSLEKDVRARTAQQASLGPSPGERRGHTALDDLRGAAVALVEGPDAIPDGGSHAWTSRVVEAARLATRAADTGVRGLLRGAEEHVYTHVMTKLSPYYFDNRIVSANLDRLTGEEEAYRFEVNVNSDSLKEQVSARLDAEPGPNAG